MNKKMLFGTLLSVIAAGCTTGLPSAYRTSMGRVEIVYMEPSANLTLCEESPLSGIQFIPVPSGLLPVVPDDNAGHCDPYHPISLPAEFSDQVKSLEFNQQVFTMFSSLVAETPWLANSKIETVDYRQHENALSHPIISDSVFYLKPTFVLDEENLYFDVDIEVDIKNFSAVHQDRNKAFAFKHKLTLIKPGMPWSEQKALARKVTFMNKDERLQLWFADNATKLRTLFNTDLLQVNQELAAYLHSRS